jgi:hypothetical protein
MLSPHDCSTGFSPYSRVAGSRRNMYPDVRIESPVLASAYLSITLWLRRSSGTQERPKSWQELKEELVKFLGIPDDMPSLKPKCYECGKQLSCTLHSKRKDIWKGYVPKTTKFWRLALSAKVLTRLSHSLKIKVWSQTRPSRDWVTTPSDFPFDHGLRVRNVVSWLDNRICGERESQKHPWEFSSGSVICWRQQEP